MLRLVVRSARAHYRQYVMTVAAVVLGVSFVVGAFVLTDSLGTGINRLLTDSVARTDLVVRPSGEGSLHRAAAASGIEVGTALHVPASLVRVIRHLPGVAVADFSVSGPAELFGKSGRTDRFDLSTAENWPDHPAMHAERLVSGTAPQGPDDVVIDSGTARSRHLRIGSRLRIGTKGGVVTPRVSGLAERAGGALGAAGAVVAFSAPRARELVGTPGEVDDISIRTNTDPWTVRGQVFGVLPPGATVLTSKALLASAHDRVDLALRTFVAVLVGFATVILFVTSFLLWNTFSIVTAQRARELALLRALGASRAQITTAVLAEGAAVGATATIIGLGVGLALAIGLRRALDHLGVELPHGDLHLDPRTILLAIAVGLGVTIVSVVGPARRAAAEAPLSAMTRAEIPQVTSRRASIAGALAIVVGLALATVGVLGHAGATAVRESWVAGGAMIIVLGLVTSSAGFVSAIVSVMDRISGPHRSVAGRLARRNAARNGRRTGAITSALMIGVALVATTLVLGASLERAFGGALRSTITADVVASAPGVVPFDQHALNAIASSRGVDDAVPIGEATGQIRLSGGPTTGLSAAPLIATTAEPVGLAHTLTPRWRSGGPPANSHQVSLSTSIADAHHLTDGNQVTVAFGDRVAQLLVSGIYRDNDLLANALVRPATLTELGAHPVTRVVLVQARGDPHRVANRITDAVSSIPNSTAGTTASFVAQRSADIDLVVGIVDIILLLAVGVAGMSIADTLGLSVLERARELGLLRTLGMNRVDLRRMIRWEGGIAAAFGGAAGTALGVAFGSAAAYILPANTAKLALPIARLVVLLLGSVVLGLVAGAWPARRAARRSPMDAVADVS